MSSERYSPARPADYPFCAVVGQEKAKMALLLHAVHARLGGVLLYGESGTAKTTLIRGAAALLQAGGRLDVPLHITEDRLLGGLDMAHAISSGERRPSPGLLGEADGRLLTVDEANLLEGKLLKTILEAYWSGSYAIEREGLSARQPSRFRLFGAMNPEEGTLPPALLDRWGLYVRVETAKEPGERMETIRRRLAFERDPARFFRSWKRETEELRGRVDRAAMLLPGVRPGEALLRLAAEIAAEGGCRGHRAEIALIETARAIAAWEGQTEVLPGHVREAAGYALPHRLSAEPDAARDAAPKAAPDEAPAAGRKDRTVDGSEPLPPDSYGEEAEAGRSPERPQGGVSPGISVSGKPAGPEAGTDGACRATAQEIVEAVGRDCDALRFAFSSRRTPLLGGTGKRNRSGVGSGGGRYVRAAAPKGRIRDLAFDATLRAAAPYQRLRRRPPESGRKRVSVLIERSDLQEKARESRAGTALLFVVDASGSMNASKRMKAVKGAVLSLLREAYRQRDYVGLVAFRGDEAELLLGMTRSVEQAERKLRAMPTGGRTPLPAGLAKGAETLRHLRRTKSGLVPAMIVLTDGKANAGVAAGLDAWQESRRIAGLVADSGVQALVIDTEQGYVRLGYARKLADALQAQYCRLEELEAGELARTVRHMLSDSASPGAGFSGK